MIFLSLFKNLKTRTGSNIPSEPFSLTWANNPLERKVVIVSSESPLLSPRNVFPCLIDHIHMMQDSTEKAF